MDSNNQLPEMCSLGESEDSSSYDPMNGFAASPSPQHQRAFKKRVSFNQIQTRVYNVVIGDHPSCADGLPVSLDWQYHDCSSNVTMLSQAGDGGDPVIDNPNIRERTQSYSFPRRLSYDERLQRILDVSGMTEDQVKDEEIDLVVRKLQESWELGAFNNNGNERDAPQASQPMLEPSPLLEDDGANLMNWDNVLVQDYGEIDDLDMSDFEWTD